MDKNEQIIITLSKITYCINCLDILYNCFLVNVSNIKTSYYTLSEIVRYSIELLYII